MVRLHRTSNWSQVLPPLAGHSLSVTSIRFSPDDRYILTASRDRSWQLYERAEDGESYARAASGAKAHARIIWDCAWAQDGNFFATAARDKQVKIWQSVEGSSQNWKVVATLALPDAATAVDLTHSNDMYVAYCVFLSSADNFVSIKAHYCYRHRSWSYLYIQFRAFNSRMEISLSSRFSVSTFGRSLKVWAS